MSENDEQKVQKFLVPIAEETLRAFEKISGTAETRLAQSSSYGPDVLANPSFASHKASQSVLESQGANRRALEVLAKEPAIARILVRRDDNDKEDVYFICRAAPPSGVSIPGAYLASYRAPVGRLASLPVGEEYELKTPRGTTGYVKVLEQAKLDPSKEENKWDSRNSTLQGQEYGPLTVDSLCSLLETQLDEDGPLLERILEREKISHNIFEKRRRNVRTKMELRDQPILDQYQDEIFRLPLERRLLILGPPGSGKTTTLIRRLGQKLDKGFLEEDELGIIERAKYSGALEHEKSWIMFTPTELLKQYLKEAFAREDIPAPDSCISTWSHFRRQLARNRFNILRTATGRGAFIEKEVFSALQEDTFKKQIKWFEDFQMWQLEFFGRSSMKQRTT